ncbi:hypothetical protein [Vibrio breoganii]|uniref:hypothetical protein n=1 Tax=Vibrio breoganii TaxID=553239 RepID=UPI000C82E0DD|nr:hypothetical protein [Vibrio breoganii]PMG95383.1 hypothetical protein BCU79_09810 [Vibrio breoganii]PMJ45366.1 hypothetical protein BCU21_13395 [Vibrio breoganii]PMK55558.1 hypothetical protein BCT97_13040 [Vibrio breoganii]PMM22514.1 hypothetical protein BCT59_04095 [Vibrio breoganii]PMM89510.1 hypothetical protein BCT44_16845 [Vibrio breoganii]
MNFFKRWIISSLLKKPAPTRIPRSGDKAKSVDCNVIYIRAKDESWTILCKKIDTRGVTGKYWLNQEEFEELSIPWDWLIDYDLDITHFYGTYDLRYSSISQYFFEGILQWDKLKIALGTVQQFLFNRKELIRSERIETLKIILEETIENRNFTVSSISLSSLLYTQKWVFHPDQSRQLAYNDLLLKSLAESGELVSVQHGFKLSPKALVTISGYEEDQKRHKDNLAQSSATKWLTLALIIVGLIQAGVTYYGVYKNGS